MQLAHGTLAYQPKVSFGDIRISKNIGVDSTLSLDDIVYQLLLAFNPKGIRCAERAPDDRYTSSHQQALIRITPSKDSGSIQEQQELVAYCNQDVRCLGWNFTSVPSGK